MTSCKEINVEGKKKRTVFDVRIDITNNSRDDIVKSLRDNNDKWSFIAELADIIEKG